MAYIRTSKRSSWRACVPERSRAERLYRAKGNDPASGATASQALRSPSPTLAPRKITSLVQIGSLGVSILENASQSNSPERKHPYEGTILQCGLPFPDQPRRAFRASPTLTGAGYSNPGVVRVAPGQITTLFITGLKTVLTSEMIRASTLPLPTSLAGISVVTARDTKFSLVRAIYIFSTGAMDRIICSQTRAPSH